MTLPTVCVVIPAYNSEATLLRALDSVAAQTLAPSEILVVDDASSDATPSLAKNYHQASVNVISLQTNAGASGARNHGIRLASADLVAFLDADDEWMPTKLEKQVQLIVTNQNSTFCSCGSSLISADGSNLGDIYRGQVVTTGPEAWKALLKDNYVTTPSVLVWRRHLLALGGFNESLKIAEDQDMWIRLAARGALSYVPEMLVRVHDRRSSLSGGSFDEQMTYTLPMVERHLERFADRLTREDRQSILGRRLLRLGQLAFSRGAPDVGRRLIWRSISMGYKPWEGLLFLLKANSVVIWLKNAIRER
ncbi:MAG TPA: glycosyltransferase family A protein [Rhizomicrobium sp.]|jgi:glycosyltransferase involved in cell wall biosynthesis